MQLPPETDLTWWHTRHLRISTALTLADAFALMLFLLTIPPLDPPWMYLAFVCYHGIALLILLLLANAAWEIFGNLERLVPASARALYQVIVYRVCLAILTIGPLALLIAIYRNVPLD